MAKKILMTSIAIVILCLCCGVTFAAENSTVSLGNEIVQSIDKTGKSINNVVSGNMTKSVNNFIRGETTENNYKNAERNYINQENYNAVRTSSEAATSESEIMNTISTTTWMWIILVVAAMIIIAAIWYYATQNNE